MSRGAGVIIILVVAGAFLAGNSSPSTGLAQEAAKDDKKTVTEWLEVWKGGKYSENRKAHQALVALGEASVKPLVALLEARDPRMGHAMKVLAELGSVARPAGGSCLWSA